MTAVCVAYRPEADYFAGFLIELLRCHRVNVRAGRGDGADPLPAELTGALAASDVLVVIMSGRSAAADPALPEVAAFRAGGPERPVVALLLDPAAEAAAAAPEMADAVRLRCYESMLESLRALLRLLGRRLFGAGGAPAGGPPPDAARADAPEAARRVTDRRVADRRAGGGDRRKSPVEQRLRVGMYKYLRADGRDLLEPVRRMTRASDLAGRLAAEDSPLRSFDFTDRRTGQAVALSYPMIEEIVLASWRARRGTEQEGAAYVVDDMVTELARCYTVTARDRRTIARRGEPRRRTGSPAR
jgi:hypothetical protein